MFCATRPACILSRLAPAKLQEIEPAIARRRLDRGQVLVREGEVARSASVVKIGTVFGRRRSLDGEDRTVSIAGRGTAFGLMGFFEQPTQVSGVAAVPSRICDIPHERLRDIAAREPSFAVHMTRTTTASIGLIADWSVGVRVRGVPNQLACTLLLMARSQKTSVLELPTHAALTELLDATREIGRAHV